MAGIPIKVIPPISLLFLYQRYAKAAPCKWPIELCSKVREQEVKILFRSSGYGRYFLLDVRFWAGKA